MALKICHNLQHLQQKDEKYCATSNINAKFIFITMGQNGVFKVHLMLSYVLLADPLPYGR